MLMNFRESDKRDRVGPHGARPDAGFDSKAVRTGIGAALRTLHSDVLREEVQAARQPCKIICRAPL
jgi:hypothetical protein